MRRNSAFLGPIVAILLASGCTLWGAGEFPSGEQLNLPAREAPELAGQRIDIFRKNRGSPDLPIENASAAIAAALGSESLVAHLRTTDSRYGGRRLAGLTWIAQAVPPEEGASAPWNVELRARIRDSSAFYVCNVGVSPDGTLAVQEPARRNCTWEAVP